MTQKPLTLQLYQSEAANTDITRKKKTLDFLLLGLFGEVGTLMDEVKKKQRDSRSYVGYETNVVEELGDVLWYLTTLATRSGLALSAIASNAILGGQQSLSVSGSDLPFHTLQPQHDLPFKVPSSAFENTLFRLVSAIGDVAAGRSATQDISADALGARLVTIFGLLVQSANEAGVTLERAAHENLVKISERWPTRKEYPQLFDPDSVYPPEERFPRSMDIEIYERVLNRDQPNERRYVLQSRNDVLIGDRVTDNIITPDDYRFHDVFHYAYVAILGWSPVIRALFRLKRRSQPAIDEAQDGARAILIEEGVSTFIFGQAKRLEFFDGQGPGDLSFTLLKRVRDFVLGYEPEICPYWQWEEAILQGYRAFRFLKERRRGTLHLDLEKHQFEID